MTVAAATRFSQLLLVDDDPATGRLIQAVFRLEHIGVSLAASATEGLAFLQQQPPQVVVLDLRLPDMNGLEVLERLQAQGSHIPVIVLTGRVDVKTVVRAMQLGAFHYLTKPMDRCELVLVVRRALDTQALEVTDRQAEQATGPAGWTACGQETALPRQCLHEEHHQDPTVDPSRRRRPGALRRKSGRFFHFSPDRGCGR